MNNLKINQVYHPGTPTKNICSKCKNQTDKLFQYNQCRVCILRYYQSPKTKSILNQINSR